MDPKTYVQEAIKTESLDFEAIRERLNNDQFQAGLFETLYAFSRIGEDLDLYKKFLFYGKGESEVLESSEPLEKANHTMSDDEVRLLHAVLGIATESQEMVDQIMNLFKGNDLDMVNLVEENGDINWYQAIMSDVSGISFESLMDKNIEKLRARYGDKFSNDKAINRDLDTEREILEKEH